MGHTVAPCMQNVANILAKIDFHQNLEIFAVEVQSTEQFIYYAVKNPKSVEHTNPI